MKKQLFTLLAIGLVAIIALGACAPQAEPITATEVPVVVEATEVPVVVEVPEVTLTDAEMEALITEKIKDKHTVEFILSQDKSAEEWSETLDRMIGYGAEISPEEKTLIIDWLVSRNK